MKRKSSSKHSRGFGSNRSSLAKTINRRACFEPLETRQLLAVTMPVLGNQLVQAGAPLNIGLSAIGTAASNPVSYTVSVNNSTTDNPNLSYSIPSNSSYLKLHVHSAQTTGTIDGDMVFQLYGDLTPNTVSKISGLVNTNFYDGLIFHRIMEDFMSQGGGYSSDGTYHDPGAGFPFNDEFKDSLKFTGAGILAMANSGANTNGSQFFVTDEPTRWLDNVHTIFGMLVEGEDIRRQLNLVPTNGSNKPLIDVIITDASIITDTHAAVLRLSAPTGETGNAVVTVTATDTVSHESITRSFTVYVQQDVGSNTNDAPVLTAAAANPALGNTSSVTPKTINVASFVNNGTGTTTISDADAGAPKGGIAISSFTGTGTWAYSLDGTNFVNIDKTKISTSSVLLLSKDAKLRYTPNGSGAETPAITYYAWDMTTGADGGLANISSASDRGSSTAFSTASDTAKLNVYVNTAPVITKASPVMGSTTKDIVKTIPLASFIKNGSGTTQITDTDPGSDWGIAIIQVEGSIPGTWEYSTDGGTTYHTISGITKQTPSLLLPKTAILRYTPDGQRSGTAFISYRAWDMTTGNVGDLVNITATGATGGTTAYSADFDMASFLINDAPVLSAKSPSMGSIDENTTTADTGIIPTTFLNGTSGTVITDVDQNAKVGIAIVGFTGNGTWQYKPFLTSTAWLPIGDISPTSALLLSSTAAKLRYIPDGKNGEAPTITYYAWDATQGTSNVRVDISQASSRGGTTPYSLLSDVATLTVTSLNDAPVLTPGAPALGTTDFVTPKDAVLSDFIKQQGTGVTIVTDVDTGTTIGGAAITGITGLGTWAYSLDGGTNYTTIASTVAEGHALLLPATAKIRYTPNVNDTGAVTIEYYAWDASSGTVESFVDLSATGATGGTTAFSTVSDTASVVVNVAPVLTAANPSLGTTDENTFVTHNLSNFINNGTGTTTIVDSTPGGIALTAVTGNGTWSYSLDNGTSYTPIVKSSVTTSNVLLLPADAKLKYTPDGNNGETASISYCAWDESTGTAGGRANISQAGSTGGGTAYSIATDLASLSVTSVNDAPVIATAAGPALGTITNAAPKTILLSDFIGSAAGKTLITDVDTDPTAIIGGIALVGVTGKGTWAYSIDDGANFTNIDPLAVKLSAALLLNKNARLRYTPNSVAESETATIKFHAWDTTFGTNGGTAILDAPGSTGGTTAFSPTSDTASLVVNTAPTLTAANPSLGTIGNNANKTITLTDIINNGTGTTIIADADQNHQTSRGGIALTGISGSGTWAYSLDGGTTFVNFTSVSPSSALLLSKGAKLKFTPAAGSSGNVTITYLAWDTSTGTAGGTVNLSGANATGEATAFSTASDIATLVVRAQPTDIALSPSSIPDSSAIGTTIGTFTTTALPVLGGTFTYTLVSGTGSDDNAAFTIVGGTLKTNSTFNAGNKSTYKIRVRTTDQQTELTYEKALTIAITDVTSPSVTINQASGQVDPTHIGQIYYRVVFSEPVIDFTIDDVTLTGTAPGAYVKKINGSGTTYEVQVGGMTDSGTVTATIDAGKVHDAAGKSNLASTSTDNTVTYQKNWVVYGGTNRDDSFVFSPGATPGTWQVLVNSTLYAIPLGTAGITLDGLGGNDSVKIVGSSGNDSFEIWQDHAIFKSPDFEVDANNMESFAIDGDGGTDSAIVHDRASAADTFSVGPGWVVMNGSTMPMSNVENLTIAATAGKADLAYMYVAPGTAGQNSLAISPASATLTMPGHVNVVQNCANVQVYTIPGGGETATFTDSSGDDLFVATPVGAQMFSKSGGSDISAWGFGNVNGTASGDTNDEARFYTISGSQDNFTAGSSSATYTGTNFENKAAGFKMVQAYADPSTNSSATLIGSSGDDSLCASPLGMQLFLPGYDLSVWSFRNVVGQSGGGHDKAFLYGTTTGTNVLDAGTDSASITAGGTTKTAVGFETVKAFGNAGSTDKATFDNSSLIEQGAITHPLDGSPYSHALLLTGFDELSTTAKPSSPTPVAHAVDSIMSAYWP
jgi:cyclophilin family peptidyl-prolyl cis-trans isomerase